MNARIEYSKVPQGAIRAMYGLETYLHGSGLERSLQELIKLRVSQINGCAYCIDMHTRDLLKAGVKQEKVALVPVYWEAQSYFTEQERAALAWAESLTLVSQTKAPDDVYAEAARQFDEKQLGDLTVAIGLMNTYNRIAIGFRREPGH